MKLISKYKDYYDHFAKNPNISEDSWRRVWRRVPTVVPVDFQVPSCGTYRCYRSFSEKYYLYPMTVFFCGQEYPVIKISPTSYTTNEKDVFCYDWQDLSQIVSDVEDLRLFYDKQNRPWVRHDFSGKALPRLNIVDMHRKLNTPVFLYHQNVSGLNISGSKFNKDEENVLIDTILSDVHFRNVVDDFECFTRIESFLANELVQPDIVDFKVPDKLNAESHGFDKFSFRKEKQPSK